MLFRCLSKCFDGSAVLDHGCRISRLRQDSLRLDVVIATTFAPVWIHFSELLFRASIDNYICDTKSAPSSLYGGGITQVFNHAIEKGQSVVKLRASQFTGRIGIESLKKLYKAFLD